MPFIPKAGPQVEDDDLRNTILWTEDELRAVEAAQYDDNIALELRPTGREPTKPREGMIIYADGTYDPGFGEGPYVYKNGLWVPLGSGLPVLQANRTYYVRTDGSNSNTGLVDSAAGAFLTIQKALDTAATIHFGGFTVTIQVRDGTYTTQVLINKAWSGGSLVIQGNAALPGNVIISVTNADAIFCSVAIPGALTIKDLKIQTVTAGSLLVHGGVGPIQWTNVQFGAAPGGAQLFTKSTGAKLVAIGNYAINGGGNFHYEAAYGGLIDVEGRLVTVTGTPAFIIFALATASGSNLVTIGSTFSGAATGSQGLAQINAAILTGGVGFAQFPGSLAGGTNSGGVIV